VPCLPCTHALTRMRLPHVCCACTKMLRLLCTHAQECCVSFAHSCSAEVCTCTHTHTYTHRCSAEVCTHVRTRAYTHEHTQKASVLCNPAAAPLVSVLLCSVCVCVLQVQGGGPTHRASCLIFFASDTTSDPNSVGILACRGEARRR